jgi:phosphate/sulfate permease
MAKSIVTAWFPAAPAATLFGASFFYLAQA